MNMHLYVKIYNANFKYTGTAISIQRCFHIANNSLVSRELCDERLRKSDLSRPCNTQPCSVTPLSDNGTRLVIQKLIFSCFLVKCWDLFEGFLSGAKKLCCCCGSLYA